MEIMEFGNKNNPKILLIHGFQSPYQIWNPYIETLQNKYHIIVPIMSGHYPNTSENFISFEIESKNIEEYCLSRGYHDFKMVFGMSMGGILTAKLWENKILKFDSIVFDGSPLMYVNKIIRNYMKNFYLKVTHKSQNRDLKTLETAKKYIMSEAYFDNFLKLLDEMSDQTIINSIDQVTKYQLSKYNDKKPSIYFFYGTKINEFIAKKSAKFIKKNYENAEIVCFKGKGHCENSLMNPEIMIKELMHILKKKADINYESK